MKHYVTNNSETKRMSISTEISERALHEIYIKIYKRIIEKSDPIPLDAIVAPENIPEDNISLYQKILTSMPLDHPFNAAMKQNLGWNAAGFDVKNDHFYNAMREALK